MMLKYTALLIINQLIQLGWHALNSTPCPLTSEYHNYALNTEFVHAVGMLRKNEMTIHHDALFKLKMFWPVTPGIENLKSLKSSKNSIFSFVFNQSEIFLCLIDGGVTALILLRTRSTQKPQYAKTAVLQKM